MTSTSPTTGYRRKPLWIYAVSLVLILTPLGNLLWSLMSLHIPKWYQPHVWTYWLRYISTTTWILLGLIFCSGVALLFVRRWTWMLSVSILALVGIYDIVMIRQFSMMGIGPLMIMVLGTLAFGLFLYLSKFRRPYLNPRVRWWETSPRFRVDLPVSLRNFDESAILVDISRTGLLLEFSPGAKIPELQTHTTVTLPTQTQLSAVVARKTARGYGLQFEKLDRAQKRALRNFIVQLAEDPSKVYRK